LRYNRNAFFELIDKIKFGKSPHDARTTKFQTLSFNFEKLHIIVAAILYKHNYELNAKSEHEKNDKTTKAHH